MMTRFNDCHKFTAKWEGGYVDHPDDRGGATKNGVTQKTYDRYRTDKSMVVRHVSQMTSKEEDEIYLTMYWQPSKAGFVWRGLDLCVYDTAVNMGPTRAIKILQRTVGAKEDGIFGQHTKEAVEYHSSMMTGVSIKYFCAIRELRYRRIVENNVSQHVFLKGWINRNDALKATALKESFFRK